MNIFVRELDPTGRIRIVKKFFFIRDGGGPRDVLKRTSKYITDDSNATYFYIDCWAEFFEHSSLLQIKKKVRVASSTTSVPFSSLRRLGSAYFLLK
jgi:hypothetical protein